jgi:hypothetical protein
MGSTATTQELNERILEGVKIQNPTTNRSVSIGAHVTKRQMGVVDVVEVLPRNEMLTWEPRHEIWL